MSAEKGRYGWIIEGFRCQVRSRLVIKFSKMPRRTQKFLSSDAQKFCSPHVSISGSVCYRETHFFSFGWILNSKFLTYSNCFIVVYRRLTQRLLMLFLLHLIR